MTQSRASRRVAWRCGALQRVGWFTIFAHTRVCDVQPPHPSHVYSVQSTKFTIDHERELLSWRSFLCWHCICGSDGEGSVAEVCGSVVYLLDASSKESITSFFTEHEIKVHKRTWSATSFQEFSFAIISL